MVEGSRAISLWLAENHMFAASVALIKAVRQATEGQPQRGGRRAGAPKWESRDEIRVKAGSKIRQVNGNRGAWWTDQSCRAGTAGFLPLAFWDKGWSRPMDRSGPSMASSFKAQCGRVHCLAGAQRRRKIHLVPVALSGLFTADSGRIEVMGP